MIERFSQDHFHWVNLECPSNEDVREIMSEYAIPPSLLDDIATPTHHNGTTSYEDMVKVVMSFPIVKRTDIDHAHEVKFIIAGNLLITAHYENMEALDRFKKKFEVIATLGKAENEITGLHLFIGLLAEYYSVIDSKLDYIESQLLEIESSIFNDKEKEMVYAISMIGKKMITFRQTIKSHDEILRDIRPLTEMAFADTCDEEFKEIHGHYFTIIRRMNSLFETLDDLRDTNMALLTTKQNEIMKTLTIMAFITFPLTLFTSAFGMNTLSTPIVGSKGDFWIIIGIMSVVTVIFFTFFKYKKWV